MERMEASKVYKYEVAFSFLKEDVDLAQQLSDRISDRLSTFIYTKRQEEVVGTEAMESFRQVYGIDARIVVILYRPKWGTTKYTRIEEDAIRARSFQTGPDFILLVKLEPGKPAWYSESCIYADFGTSGEDEIIGYIEYMVKSRGGNVRRESVEDLAARMNREVERIQQFESLYNSNEGLQAAKKMFAELQVHYVKRREELNYLPGGSGSVIRDKHYTLTTIGDKALSFQWKNEFTNSLKNARLTVEVSNGKRFGLYVQDDHKTDMSAEYVFAQNLSGEYGWRPLNEDGPVFTNAMLVDHWLKECIALYTDGAVADIKKSLR